MPRTPLASLTADNHLCLKIWRGRPLYRDSWHAFRHIVDKTVEWGLKALVVAGDLFDESRPDPETFQFFVQMLQLLRSHDVYFLFVNGNHDPADPPWPVTAGLDEWDRKTRIIHLQPRSGARIGGLHVTGVDYAPPSEWLEACKTISPKTNILVTHQRVRQFLKGGNAAVDLGALPASPCRGYQRLVVGDYHSWAEEPLDNNWNALSPGSSCLVDVGEDPQKSFAILYDDLTISAEPIPRRPLYNLGFIHNEPGLDAALLGLERVFAAEATTPADLLPDDLRRAIVRVTYDPAVPQIRRRLFKAVNGRAELFAFPRRWILPTGQTLGKSTNWDDGGPTIPALIKRRFAQDPQTLALAWDLDSAESLADWKAILQLAAPAKESPCSTS